MTYTDRGQARYINRLLEVMSVTYKNEEMEIRGLVDYILSIVKPEDADIAGIPKKMCTGSQQCVKCATARKQEDDIYTEVAILNKAKRLMLVLSSGTACSEENAVYRSHLKMETRPSNAGSFR